MHNENFNKAELESPFPIFKILCSLLVSTYTLEIQVTHAEKIFELVPRPRGC